MATHLPHLLLSASVLLLPAALAGQEGGEEPDPKAIYKENRTRLLRGIGKVTGSNGFRFKGTVSFPGTKERQQPGAPGAGIVMMGFIGGRITGERIEGSVFADGLATFTLDGTRKGATMGTGLNYYRTDDDRWRPRLGTDLAGNRIWWNPNPRHLLQEIGHLLRPGEIPAGITLEKKGIKRIDLRFLQEFQLTITGKTARDLLLAGYLPDPGKAPRQGRAMVLLSSSLNGDVPIPEDLRYRLSIWSEVRSGTIHKLQVLASGKPVGTLGGNVIRFGKNMNNPKNLGIPQLDRKERRVSLVVDMNEFGKPDWSTRNRSLEKRLRLKHLPPPAAEKGSGAEPGRESAKQDRSL